MPGQMTIAIALPGLNDLGPAFGDFYFSFEGSFSLPSFYDKRKN